MLNRKPFQLYKIDRNHETFAIGRFNTLSEAIAQIERDGAGSYQVFDTNGRCLVMYYDEDGTWEID